MEAARLPALLVSRLTGHTGDRNRASRTARPSVRMITMNEGLIRFVRAELDADEHNVVMITSLAPPDTDVTLDSTIPMIDMVREVTDLYASVAHLDVPDTVPTSNDYDAGRAAGLGAAVRLLAQTYQDSPGYRQEWRPQPLP